MHSPALDQLRLRALNSAMKAQLLPRGTNSARRSGPNFSAPQAGLETKPKLVDVNKSTNPVHARGLALCTGVKNHAPTLMKKQLFLRARHNQTIRGQSETVEQHMNLTKPVRHRYPEPVKAHDYADDWKRENHAHAPKADREYLKALREAYDNQG